MSVIHPSQVPEQSTGTTLQIARVRFGGKESVRSYIEGCLTEEQYKLRDFAAAHMMAVVRSVDVIGACTITHERDTFENALECAHRVSRLQLLLKRCDHLLYDDADGLIVEMQGVMRRVSEEFIEWAKRKEELDLEDRAAISLVASTIFQYTHVGERFNAGAVIEFFKMPTCQRREAYVRFFALQESVMRMLPRGEDQDFDAIAHANFTRRTMRALYAHTFLTSGARLPNVDEALKKECAPFSPAQRTRMENNIESDERRMIVERRAKLDMRLPGGVSIDSDKGL